MSYLDEYKRLAREYSEMTSAEQNSEHGERVGSRLDSLWFGLSTPERMQVEHETREQCARETLIRALVARDWTVAIKLLTFSGADRTFYADEMTGSGWGDVRKIASLPPAVDAAGVEP
jgi:hypothetical protein